jgi:transposase
VVVDHDRGRLVWAAPGACEATLEQFFDTLGEPRCAKVELVSADAAEWIAAVVARRCPAAVRCADPFHVARVGHRRPGPGPPRGLEHRPQRRRAVARELKGARFALWKNPQDLPRRQRGKLARIAVVNQRLYRAYLLKEEPRLVFKVKGPRAVALLDAWLSWARRCRIPAFVALARSVTAYRDTIVASLLHGASNARGGIGQHQAAPADPNRVRVQVPPGADRPGHAGLGGLCPQLPGRA